MLCRALSLRNLQYTNGITFAFSMVFYSAYPSKKTHSCPKILSWNMIPNRREGLMSLLQQLINILLNECRPLNLSISPYLFLHHLFTTMSKESVLPPCQHRCPWCHVIPSRSIELTISSPMVTSLQEGHPWSSWYSWPKAVPSYKVSGVCATEYSRNDDVWLPKQGHKGHHGSSLLSGITHWEEHQPPCCEDIQAARRGPGGEELRSPVSSYVSDLGNNLQPQWNLYVTVVLADTRTAISRETQSQNSSGDTPKFLTHRNWENDCHLKPLSLGVIY